MPDDEVLAERGRLLLDQLDEFAGAADGHRLDPAPPDALDHLLRLRIVGPDHRRAIGRKQLVEQPHLGLEIGLHRRMVVEVVAAEVGERDGLQRHALGAVLVEPVRGRLIGDMG